MGSARNDDDNATRPILNCWPGCHAEVVGWGQPNRGLHVVVIERDANTPRPEWIWIVRVLGRSDSVDGRRIVYGRASCADVSLRPVSAPVSPFVARPWRAGSSGSPRD